ncbi:MAG: hypothetical protein ACXVAM_08000 [Vulcanimicrobiaceae bacterium]
MRAAAVIYAIAVLLVLVLYGGGKYSLDALVARNFNASKLSASEANA